MTSNIPVYFFVNISLIQSSIDMSQPPQSPAPGTDALAKLDTMTTRFNAILDRFLVRFNEVLEKQAGKTLDTLGRIQESGSLKISGTVGRAVGASSVAVVLGALSAIPGVGSAVSVARGLDAVGKAAGTLLTIVAETITDLTALAVEIKTKFNTEEQRELLDAITDILIVQILLLGEIIKMLGIKDPQRFTETLRGLGVDMAGLGIGDLASAI